MALPKIGGMPGFAILWLSQACSFLGGSMASFAITLWIYQQTGKATPVTLLEFFTMTPLVLFSVLAGVMVDRYKRRLMIIVSDVAGLCVNLVIVWLFLSHNLEVWHLYVGGVVIGFFQTVQWPAVSAVVTLMVDKKHYARTASMMDMASQFSGILSPILAGALMSLVGLSGVLFTVLAACAFSVIGTLCVDIPEGKRDQARASRSIPDEVRESLHFIAARKPLIWVQCLFMSGNFFFALSFALLGPFILARSGNNALMFSTVMTTSAIGGIAGASLIASTGGVRNRITSINLGWTGGALLGLVVIGLSDSRTGWMVGAFLEAFMMSFVSSANQSLWQSKVPAQLQGRVFGLRRLLAQVVAPVAGLVGGPLADHVLEPAMQPGGWLAHVMGSLIRIGPGAGIGLLMVCSGLAVAATNLVTLFVPAIRKVDVLVPDSDAINDATASQCTAQPKAAY